MNGIVVLGGDLRNYHLYPILCSRYGAVDLLGFDSLDGRYAFTEDALRRAAVVVAPVPFSLDSAHLNAPYSRVPLPLERVLPLLDAVETVVSGAVGGKLPSGKAAVDLYDDEEFVMKTAVATVEGIVEILIRESDITLHGSRVLIVGMGRIGSRSGRLLKQLGAFVTVVTDDAGERGNAFAEGFPVAGYGELRETVGGFDFILNTAPFPYFDAAVAERLSPGTVFLDVASPPGALRDVDPARLRCRFFQVRGIPGRTAPRTMAAGMADCLERLLESRGFAMSSAGS